MCHGVTREGDFQFYEPVTRYHVVFPNLTHWDRDKIAPISQTTFSNAFSCMKHMNFAQGSNWQFFPKVRIDNFPALVWIMAWCRPGHKLLSEPMMVNLLTHMCVTRYQWVNTLRLCVAYMHQWTWVIIASGNGLSAARCQALTRTNIYLISVWRSGIHLSEIQINILWLSLKVHIKLSPITHETFWSSLSHSS